MSEHAHPYTDGTYGTPDASASTDLERDQHVTFTDQQSVVMALAFTSGSLGITGHDVQAATGWGDSPKSRALSNLLRDGKLVRLTERRDRGSVHVLPEFAFARAEEPYRSIADKHFTRGENQGHNDGFSAGLTAAFKALDGSDSMGEAMILLRRMMAAAGPNA